VKERETMAVVTKRSLVAAAVGVLVMAPTQSPSAFAVANAKAISPSQNFSSASIVVFPSGTQTFTNPAVAFSTSVSNGVAKSFFINNGGTRSISQFSFTVTLPANANISYFRRCNLGVLFTGANTCASGSTTNIPITAGTEITLTLPLVQGTFYQFRIIENKTGTVTVNTRVNSASMVVATSNS
jgi:hypothetical protein